MRRCVSLALLIAFMVPASAASEGVHIITLPGQAAAPSVADYPEPHAEEPSGVPEPAIWAMMILGFGVIGGMLRQSRG